tara:strand:- start:39066 stop:40166 length:1101 start_codon:yes stop_codon:yes gene_type:complete
MLIMGRIKLSSSILNPVIEAKYKSLVYRFRFLGLYVIFGLLSIIIEFIIRGYLSSLGFEKAISTLLAIVCGILFAFWTNVNFNFKIPKSRRNRALIYFVIISVFSGLLQLFFNKALLANNFSYELNRIFISSIVFLFAYGLHRRYTFRDFKKVGVAIYANGLENLEQIHSRIGYYADFIHVDVVDKTMSESAEDVETYRMETMKAYWPNIQIQTHIMSYNPAQWLEQTLPYSDVVYVHVECGKDIESLISKIKKAGKKAGIALTMSTDIKSVSSLLIKADYILLLTIPNPGSSGQKFDLNGLEKIKEINNLSFRKQFVLCIDGGVNENIVSMLEAENIVSGSSVLNDPNPKRKIMRLQTASRYESA